MGNRDSFDQYQVSQVYLPPTPRQTLTAGAFSAVLLLGFAMAAPFAGKPLPLWNGFIPALDAIIFVTDLITASLLLAQFSITGSRALSALSCGYLYSALIVAAHGLTFPGAFSTAGTVLSGPESYLVNFRFYLYWHLGLPVAFIAYIWLKMKDYLLRDRHVHAVRLSVCSVAGVIILVSCVIWLATTGHGSFPSVLSLSGDTRFWPTMVTTLVCVVSLSALWVFRSSAFDQWLMVVMLAMIIELVITALIGGRAWRTGANSELGSTFGVYTGRVFSLITSTVVLTALLAETTRLYGRLVHVSMLAGAVRASQGLSSEVGFQKLIDRFMTVALENAGADNGLLILTPRNEYLCQAKARTIGGHIEVIQGQPTTPFAFPETIIRLVHSTQDVVVLDDTSEPNIFSADEYFRNRPAKSILCVPLIEKGLSVGVLFLEATSTSHAFNAARIAVLELLVAQAAISLENTHLYADLELQVGLLQQLPVSAWTLQPDGTPDFVNRVWLDFSGQTLEFVRSHPEAWMTAVHPEDREMAASIFWEAVRSGRGFAFETRTLRAQDGTYRRHLQQAVVLRDAEGRVLKFVGTTTDIDDQKRAEETLRQAQSDLAHVMRVATLNTMTASIAHEVNQPLSGIMINAGTGLRMLTADPPNVVGAVETFQRTIRDANRASGVIKRLQEMFSNKAPIVELVDLNDAAQDVILISAGELRRRKARLQTELAGDLPLVGADRVQLQQVILNLLLNAADSMDGIEDRPRYLLVRTELGSDGAIRLEVRDSGTGFDPAILERLFAPFYTTKANGMGVGLAICRSIIESHKGRLWAMPNDGPGSTVGFSIPIAGEAPAAAVSPMPPERLHKESIDDVAESARRPSRREEEARRARRDGTAAAASAHREERPAEAVGGPPHAGQVDPAGNH
jgi:PAS domain S-box-containing protein